MNDRRTWHGTDHHVNEPHPHMLHRKHARDVNNTLGIEGAVTGGRAFPLAVPNAADASGTSYPL